MIWNIIFSCNLALASNADHDYYVQYSGSTDASWGYHPNCTFTVEKIVDNRFIGEFAALNLGTYSFSEKISGKVYTSNDSFTCSFTVKFYNNRYYSNVVATVYPYEGKCECFCVGSWHLEDFTMTGTKISKTYNIKPSDFEDDKLNYSQEDFNICLNSSANIYDKEFNNNSEIPDLLYNSLLENNFYVDPESTESSLENFQDSDPNNISYTISYRENDYMTRSCSKEKIADMIVILRGTNADEWSGNTEITGTAYDSEQLTHKNFKQAKDSLKPYIDNEYKYLKHQKNYDKVNLIITGHSRGAAVANLYAKDATDYNDTPYFNSVIAYTFAAPNVEKYNSDMESYDNIYNFCIKEDLVPTVPLTNPTQGWNYWKYGHTYNLDSNTYGVSNAGIISVHAAFTQWNSIKKYYEKPLIATNGKVTTLYNTLHDILGIVKTNDDLCRIINSKKVINKLGSYYQLTPLIESAIINAYSIGKAHSYNLYSDKMQGLSLNDFDEYSYNDSLNDLRYVTNLNNKILKDVIDDPITLSFDNINYNEAEVLKLISFANTNSNNNILKWDLDNPNTWNEIVWDDNGKIKEIDFSYLNLSGTLDCSNLSSLKNVNVYGNNINQIVLTNCNSLENLNIADNNINNIDLSDCINLKSLNCSFNNLSSLSRSIIDSNNAQLEYLYCDGCGLSYLDISSQSELKEISCSFNSLKNIELSENSKIASITCCYNYLDIHEGSTLYNKLDDLMFSDCYVNYYPQSVPDNATFDTTELNALKTFANTNNNNTALNWLDDSGNIDTEKLQNNVLFEYDGNKYRVVAIDISDLNVSGALDLTHLLLLQELYCENTKVTTLNINGCTKLEILHCDNCELESLTLPSNADSKASSLYDVSCEYNYLDINIFNENIIKYIEFKAGASLNYKKQYINKELSAFDESDYNLLINFANQRNNNKILDWNLSTPGKWKNVSWKFDNTSGKYKLSECHFDFMKVKGNIDVSGCDMLDEVSFSGSKINTVTISGKNLNDSTFYDCSELEAVIIKGGSEIYEGTFKMCPTLQAIYIPSDITEIADNAFENSSNITITGVADSYAQTYANEHNINFKPGAFICGNIVAKENLDDSYQYYYPVEDVSIVYNDEVQSTSDKLGYFVLFSTESGETQYKLEYPYGYNINQTTSITNNEPLIIENPIGLICYDWRNDGYINAKDYLKLSDQIKRGSEATGIDDKYFDINKDGKVTEEDWELANNFLLYSNPNK